MISPHIQEVIALKEGFPSVFLALFSRTAMSEFSKLAVTLIDGGFASESKAIWSRYGEEEKSVGCEFTFPSSHEFGFSDGFSFPSLSQSAYITKSAGYWEKTTEGRAAMERYEEDMKTVKGRQNDSFECRRKFCGVSLVRSLLLLFITRA